MDHVKKYLNVGGLIGAGAFGRVLVTSPLQNNSQQQPQQQPQHQIDSPQPDQPQPIKYALKCITPILKPARLTSELRFLRDLGGKHNVVQLHTAHFQMGSLFMVMELIEHDKFVDVVAKLTLEEIVMYMKALLESLQHVHSHNVVHRDIKPANFLFNRKHRKFLLVDFGLAQVRLGPIAKKRQPPLETSDIDQTLKKLRVSNASSDYARVSKAQHNFIYQSRLVSAQPIEKPREHMRLVANAYESPVTNNDASTRRDRRGAEELYCQFPIPSTPRRQLHPARCNCVGQPKVCSACLAKPESGAPKAGTPGYKAPEILLRYRHQNTAIDIWSAGVIFASLLSGHTPFFRDVDDVTALGDIITLLGSHKIATVAKQALNTRLLVKPRREPHCLRHVCKTIRLNNKEKAQIDIPDVAFELLNRMLDPDPTTRITANEALKYFGTDESTGMLTFKKID